MKYFLIILMLAITAASNKIVTGVSVTNKLTRVKFVADGHAFNNPEFRIVVIDTGFNQEMTSVPVKICKKGHWDALTNEDEVGFVDPHGTYVAATIAQELNALKVNYCIVVIQAFGEDGLSEDTIVKALKRAERVGASAVNISMTGFMYFHYEKEMMKEVIAAGIPIFTAAGNDRVNLDLGCTRFPACYRLPGQHVIGAISPDGLVPDSYSNFGGAVTAWYPGMFIDQAHGTVMHGTSFATPRAIASYIYSLALIQSGR